VLGDSTLRLMLALARRVLDQPHQPGPKVYSLHAPELVYIGQGMAHPPDEFGGKEVK
jgi:IS5 family transposase